MINSNIKRRRNIMKKKTIIKIMSIALMVVMIAMCLNNVVLATGEDTMALPGGKSTTTSGTFQNILNKILGITQVIGVAIAVIMLIVLAIKYISAAPSDKADIKKSAVAYIVGAVVLFAASGILGIIRTFAENNIKEGTD